MNRFASVALLLVACGGGVASPAPPDPAPASTGDGIPSGVGTGEATGPDTILASAIAVEEVAGATTFETFSFTLEPQTTTSDRCSGADVVTATCCSFPPPRPPSTQPPGDSTATVTEPSAGTVTLTDASTNGSIGTFPYENGIYPHVPATFDSAVWQPGDRLRVDATGAADIGAFSVSATTLAVPTVVVPPSIARTKDLVVTWTPDPNAEKVTMILDGSNSRIVACFADDAAGTVTIDASLLALFSAGSRFQGVAERRATHFGRTPKGRIQFDTIAWFTFDTTGE